MVVPRCEIDAMPLQLLILDSINTVDLENFPDAIDQMEIGFY